ncbi:MAG: flagellar biosynthesis protein FlhB [Pseudomonadota bacterium]|nr:flagellar biosynthesis protein FlhB [Pseudomonadota bacterium]
MADDEDKSSKTEEASPRKLQRLKDEGQVPKSREVNNFAMMLAMLLVLFLTFPLAMDGLLEFTGSILSQAGTQRAGTGLDAAFALEQGLVNELLKILPTFLVLMAFAYFGGVIQTGPIFSHKPIVPKLSKISLIKGFERMFSTRSLMELLKSMIKLFVIGFISVLIIFMYLPEILLLNDKNAFAAVSTTLEILLRIMAAVVAIAFALSIIDFLFQRMKFLEEQKMSRRELKDELKEQDGDPYVKGRQRQIREQRARQRMMADVPKASVVVTNPTHYAVALSYDEEVDAAPSVVAKGTDLIALRIREIAQENDIPLYEDPPLARQLHADVEIGETIPLELFEAVAKVVAYIFSLKKNKAS